jgi:hypothetical protein
VAERCGNAQVVGVAEKIGSTTTAALLAVMGWLCFSVRGEDESQFRTPTAA